MIREVKKCRLCLIGPERYDGGRLDNLTLWSWNSVWLVNHAYIFLAHFTTSCFVAMVVRISLVVISIVFALTFFCKRGWKSINIESMLLLDGQLCSFAWSSGQCKFIVNNAERHRHEFHSGTNDAKNMEMTFSVRRCLL